MKKETAVKALQSLAPEIEAKIEQIRGVYVITVLRLADDGVCGWIETARSRTMETALRLATDKVMRRIAEESQRIE